jgi:hypothetical protein
MLDIETFTFNDPNFRLEDFELREFPEYSYQGEWRDDPRDRL